jgi:hypothetical protein
MLTKKYKFLETKKMAKYKKSSSSSTSRSSSSSSSSSVRPLTSATIPALVPGHNPLVQDQSFLKKVEKEVKSQLSSDGYSSTNLGNFA